MGFAVVVSLNGKEYKTVDVDVDPGKVHRASLNTNNGEAGVAILPFAVDTVRVDIVARSAFEPPNLEELAAAAAAKQREAIESASVVEVSTSEPRKPRKPRTRTPRSRTRRE